MNIDELVALKTRLLQNPNDRDAENALSIALQSMSDEESHLAEDELNFISQFWQETGTGNDVQPSPELRSNFYQMLEQKKQPQAKSGNILTAISDWFSGKPNAMQPAFQFALVCVVFMAGMGTQTLIQKDDTTAVTALETQVEELNVMVALSLLQKSSASERLSGVAYSSRGGQMTETLVTELLKLLESDKSTAVRLAIIDALSDYAMIEPIEDQILAALLKQENVLVQIQLIELIKNHGSSGIISQLHEVIDDERIHDEVREAFLSQDRTSNI